MDVFMFWTELINSEIKKISELRNSGFFCFHFSVLKFPSYEKLAVASQFDLTQIYDVIIRNSVYLLGNSKSLPSDMWYEKHQCKWEKGW